MYFYISFSLIYILFLKYIYIECNAIKSTANYSDYNNDDYYDNRTDGKIFDVIEEQDLIDAIKESEVLYKRLFANNFTKHEIVLNENFKKYLLYSNQNHVFDNEFEQNLTKVIKNNTKSFAIDLTKPEFSPFVKNSLHRLNVLSRPLIQRLLSSISPISDFLYESELSPLCMAAIIRLSKGLDDGTEWALRWMDSMGRIPSGLLDGSTFDFGEYDQCLDNEMPNTPTNDLIIKGKYCLGGISSKDMIDRFSLTGDVQHKSKTEFENKFFGHKNVRLISREAIHSVIDKIKDDSGIPDTLLDFSTITDFTYRGYGLPIAVCIPDTCSAQELNRFINKSIYPKTGIPFGIAGGCHTREEPTVLDTHQIIAISTFAVLMVVMIISSFVDFFSKRNQFSNFRNNLWTKVLLSFSYQKNLKALAAPPKQIQCIDGIRVIASVWIFICHTYLFNIIMSFTWRRPKASFLPVFETDGKYLLIRNAYLTETFFFMSSFLFTFIMFPKIEKMKGKVNYLLLIFIRWLRFIPPLMASILLLYLAPLFGSGPIFRSAFQAMNYPCYRNWFKNILFINNIWLETIDEMCNGPTWYLSAEFQLFLFAPWLLILLYRRPKFTTILLVFLSLFGCVTAILPALILDKWPTVKFLHFEDPEQLYIDLYYYLYAPYAHLSAYALGILMGYVMRKYSNYCKNLKPLTVGSIWVLSIALGVFVFTFNKDWSKPGRDPTTVEIMFLVAIKSLAISGFTCGVTFNCANGYGGFLNNFLSWRVWTPLGRLSMGVYLYQMPVIFHRVYSTKYSPEMTDHFILTTVAFDIFITFIIAFVLYMTVEGPFGFITLLLATPEPKIDKSLNNEFNRNVYLIKTNIQLKCNPKDVNNNKTIDGSVNLNFANEEKL